MLNPSMHLLLKNVGNRYLLVNLAAQRARDIAEEAEKEHLILEDKPVKIALDEIAEGKIQYRSGPKPEAEPVDLDGDLFAEGETETESAPENTDEQL
jgi:DNA-directed RNA polymerase omega subunit